MKEINYYWVDSDRGILEVNGVRMTPDEAYLKYPEHKKEIKEFVDWFNSPERKKERAERLSKLERDREMERNKRNLTSSRGKADVKSLLKDIKTSISSIFKECKIQSQDHDEQSKFIDAYMLFRYIVTNSKYDESIMQEKARDHDDIYTAMVKDVHRCLCEHRSVCTSDASALSLLFEQANIPSHPVTIADYGNEPRGVHEVVEFKIAGKDYICDPTLVRSTLESGKISEVSSSVFAFTKKDFFDKLYPTKEIKFEHDSLTI